MVLCIYTEAAKFLNPASGIDSDCRAGEQVASLLFWLPC